MRIVRPLSLALRLLVVWSAAGGAAAIGWMAAPGARPWPLLIGGALGLVGSAWASRSAVRRWQLTRQSPPAALIRWLEAHVPFYGRLDAAGRERFVRDMRFVLAEYTFEAVGAAHVTDAHRWAVAAGIALLVHGRPTWEMPGTRTILFYPDRFDDAYAEGPYADYDGMAHAQGPLLMSAPAVARAWANPHDGDNVVLHELAHLFDLTGHGADGVPTLVAAASVEAWQALVKRELRAVRRGRSPLRSYAGTAPSELFAVAVEVFVERPDILADARPALFDALVALFQLDPRRPSAAPPQAAPNEQTIPSETESPPPAPRPDAR
ncbi:zinc-dependent peptidase [Salisaeta longa]|uniref:zinc-dependent peptidase n=1 Tax=Salisaeta longa TaxID=503170 RepID=UPI0003B552EA|nr:zinc-dependent peptidase [Salisaeta longa]